MTAPFPSSNAPRRRLPVIIGVAGVAAIAAFAAIYFLFFGGDSPEPLRLSTPATTTGGATATTAAGATATTAAGATATTAAFTAAPADTGVTGNWAIGNGSVAGYRVREKLARLPAQSDAVGRTSSITGSITVNRQGSQLVVAQGAKFEVDVSSLKSDESMRDSRIRTMGLESSRFPTATFVTASPIQLPASAESAQAKADVTGDLTIHGVTKRVTIPLETQINGGRIEVVGSHTFPFADFDMSPPNIGGFVTVENNATLEFRLFFDKK